MQRAMKAGLVDLNREKGVGGWGLQEQEPPKGT